MNRRRGMARRRGSARAPWGVWALAAATAVLIVLQVVTGWFGITYSSPRICVELDSGRFACTVTQEPVPPAPVFVDPGLHWKWQGQGPSWVFWPRMESGMNVIGPWTVVQADLVEIPVWCVLAPVGALALLRWHAWRRRGALGACGACGYDLSGLTSGAPCPECAAVQVTERLEACGGQA
ncbi:MAG: hypothetical protein ACREJO_00485 [Phycisphaerales bacterium]